MIKLILSAVIAAVYTFMFLLFPLVVAYRTAKIKEANVRINYCGGILQKKSGQAKA